MVGLAVGVADDVVGLLALLSLGRTIGPRAEAEETSSVKNARTGDMLLLFFFCSQDMRAVNRKKRCERVL